jgi:hypothetical protein
MLAHQLIEIDQRLLLHIRLRENEAGNFRQRRVARSDSLVKKTHFFTPFSPQLLYFH